MDIQAQETTESLSSVFEDIVEAVQVHCLSLDNYRHEECNARVDQLVDTDNLLRDIDKEHFYALTGFFYNYKY